jgi:two-component system, cell cycle response regulator
MSQEAARTNGDHGSSSMIPKNEQNEDPTEPFRVAQEVVAEEVPPLPPTASESGATTRFDLNMLRAARRGQERRENALTIIAGEQLGLTVILPERPLVIGRDTGCDLPITGRGISRRHVRLERDSKGSARLVDLNSTNGVLVNGERVRDRTLEVGDRVQLGPETVLKLIEEDVSELEVRIRRYDEATRDDLTGIYNRRYFISSLENEMAFALRHGVPVSLILFDVDFFKRINDTHGHRTGDYVLRRLVDEVARHLRAEDIFARYGGEEFAVTVRGQGEAQAWETAERIRAMVERLRFEVGGGVVQMTVSLGVATMRNGNPRRPHELIARADQRLYVAKNSGRNRTMGRPPFDT